MFVNKEIVGVDSGDYESAIYFSAQKKKDKVSHDPVKLRNWLGSLDKKKVVFACESKNDPFVKNALEFGFSVFATSSIQACFLRKLTHISGKKDDPSDAKVHAEGLNSRPGIFCEVVLNEENIEALKVLTNFRDTLIEERVACENKLRALLKETFPSLHQQRMKFGVQWVLRFLIEVPNANLFKNLEDPLLMKRLQKRFKLEARELVEMLSPFQLKENKALEINTHRVRYLAKGNLERLQIIRRYEREMEEVLEQINQEYKESDSDLGPVEILSSYPQMGVNTLSKIIGEFPAILTLPNSQTLCAYAGVTPVTKSSGKTTLVHRRYARNKKLQNAFCQLSKNTLKINNSKMRELFTKHRARGKSEYHAYRAMSRVIIRTLCAMIKTQTLYKTTV